MSLVALFEVTSSSSISPRSKYIYAFVVAWCMYFHFRSSFNRKISCSVHTNKSGRAAQPARRALMTHLTQRSVVNNSQLQDQMAFLKLSKQNILDKQVRKSLEKLTGSWFLSSTKVQTLKPLKRLPRDFFASERQFLDSKFIYCPNDTSWKPAKLVSGVKTLSLWNAGWKYLCM